MQGRPSPLGAPGPGVAPCGAGTAFTEWGAGRAGAGRVPASSTASLSRPGGKPRWGGSQFPGLPLEGAQGRDWSSYASRGSARRPQGEKQVGGLGGRWAGGRVSDALFARVSASEEQLEIRGLYEMCQIEKGRLIFFPPQIPIKSHKPHHLSSAMRWWWGHSFFSHMWEEQPLPLVRVTILYLRQSRQNNWDVASVPFLKI